MKKPRGPPPARKKVRPDYARDGNRDHGRRKCGIRQKESAVGSGYGRIAIVFVIVSPEVTSHADQKRPKKRQRHCPQYKGKPDLPSELLCPQKENRFCQAKGHHGQHRVVMECLGDCESKRQHCRPERGWYSLIANECKSEARYQHAVRSCFDCISIKQSGEKQKQCREESDEFPTALLCVGKDTQQDAGKRKNGR